MREISAPKCERESDLVSFLYGELSESETPAFERHVHECASCRAELAGFKSVRRSVVDWRNESLGLVTSSVNATKSRAEPQKPSALAALREFLSLSPLWLKGAVAFVSLLFCLLAGLTVARWLTSPTVGPVVAKSGYSQEEVDRIVEQRLRAERDKLKETTPAAATVAISESAQTAKQTGNRLAVTRHGKSEFAKRPLSRTEREQLAADLRLASANDSDLDLVGDTLNQ